LYLRSQNYSKALLYLHQALKLLDSYPGNSTLVLVLNNLANTYLSINKLDSAENYSKLMSGLVKQYKINWAKSENLRTIGRIHYKKRETRLALDFFRQSLIYNPNDQSVNYSFRAETSYEIAKIYQQTNRLDSAIVYAQKSLDDAQKGKSYSSIVAAGNLLAGLYETKDAQKTIGYNKITIAAQDSLNNFGKTNAFKSISEFDEKERQYEIETVQIAYKNQIRQYALLAGLGVFLLIAFILYRNNKKQKKANKLLHQQKEEINAALSQLKSTQTQLIQSEKMASLGELTAGIAHEIQNPLNFVNNFSEVSTELTSELKVELKNSNIDLAISLADDIEQNLQKISHHGKRADFIVKGMLQHSRTSTGEKQLTNINTLADEFLKLSYHGLRAKDKSFNAELVTNFDKNLPQVKVVQQDIGRVLLNLFNNAFYAVNERTKNKEQGVKTREYKPTVEVSTSVKDGFVVITVRDNGIGIPEAIKEKIMQPFFTTKPTGEGTGLGLSLSYDIVKAHGGNIQVETKEGEGSEFIIELPKNTL
ncbi:MAG: tetratricopeptide repeat-containing sensor histidine kinase, partial [Daejeonella sp.]